MHGALNCHIKSLIPWEHYGEVPLTTPVEASLPAIPAKSLEMWPWTYWALHSCPSTNVQYLIAQKDCSDKPGPNFWPTKSSNIIQWLLCLSVPFCLEMGNQKHLTMSHSHFSFQSNILEICPHLVILYYRVLQPGAILEFLCLSCAYSFTQNRSYSL